MRSWGKGTGCWAVLAIEGEGINKDWGALRCGAKHGGHGGHGEEHIKSVQIREIGGICGLFAWNTDNADWADKRG